MQSFKITATVVRAHNNNNFNRKMVCTNKFAYDWIYQMCIICAWLSWHVCLSATEKTQRSTTIVRSAKQTKLINRGREMDWKKKIILWLSCTILIDNVCSLPKQICWDLITFFVFPDQNLGILYDGGKSGRGPVCPSVCLSVCLSVCVCVCVCLSVNRFFSKP